MSHLLIDGKNALYRAVYATKVNTNYGTKHHSVVILFKQIVQWINKFRPTSVHIFWDAPRATVWRRKILPTYKDREQNDYIQNIAEDLHLAVEAARDIFQYCNIRQYNREAMEADDLIFAASSILHPKQSIIVSTDSDMVQIPYTFTSSSVYDPKKQEVVAIPDVHPAFLKSLVGDTSDNVPGYYGIGPVKGKAMLNNISDLYKFLDLKGSDIYYRNLLLIDLSVCPKLLVNKAYVQKKMASEIEFSDSSIKEKCVKHGVHGFDIEYHDIIPFFKNLS